MISDANEPQELNATDLESRCLLSNIHLQTAMEYTPRFTTSNELAPTPRSLPRKCDDRRKTTGTTSKPPDPQFEKNTFFVRQGSHVSGLGMDDPVDIAIMKSNFEHGKLSKIPNEDEEIDMDMLINETSLLCRPSRKLLRPKAADLSVASDHTAKSGEGFDREVFQQSLTEMEYYYPDEYGCSSSNHSNLNNGNDDCETVESSLVALASNGSFNNKNIEFDLSKLPTELGHPVTPDRSSSHHHKSCSTIFYSPVAVPIPKEKSRALPSMNETFTQSPVRSPTAKNRLRRSISLRSTEFQLDLS